ncbi:MAG: TIR domain-containing protein [Anaerolineae bacterium]|nr:TIR domain-containing protein [Anaerolineae bacterium]
MLKRLFGGQDNEPENNQPPPADEPREEQPPQDNTPREGDFPPGVELLYTLRGHTSRLRRIAWSPDGQTLASSSADNTIRLWDAATGQHFRTLKGHVNEVISVAWLPDGQTLASASWDQTVRLWEAATGQTIHTLQGYSDTVYSVAWSPSGKMLASGSADIWLWDAITGQHFRTLEGHSDSVYSVAWSPDGQTLASAANDSTIRLWDASTGHHLRTLEGHTNGVYTVTWSPDGRILASASPDNTIRLWEAATGQHLRTLEGHTDEVTWAGFSPDGRLFVSKSSDSVRLWRGDTWDAIATLVEPAGGSGAFFPGGDFNPTQSHILATVGTENSDIGDDVINVWKLDYDILLGQAPTESVGYTNSRVVLVGDTGVGKSGLALVLMDQPWEPTDSTHARKIYTLQDKTETLPNGRREQRETLLWDLAGQPGYRIIHQLQLTEVAVALLCFDARSDTDPFAGVKYWNRALAQAQKARQSDPLPMRKYLVSARIDRGGLAVSAERIQQLMNDLGFDGYFETSAREGWGIGDLKQAVCSGIDWDTLPRVSSTGLFVRIKDFLTAKKESGLPIITENALYSAYLDSEYAVPEDRDVRAEFATVIGRVESRGLIRRLSFGNLVLLQPELLDAYASSMVFAAREEPDGLGFISEELARTGRFNMSSDERLPESDRELEKLLLIATVEDLLRHEIALRDADNLIFPSQFLREREDYPNPEGKAATYTFEGAVQNIYTRLAVRLARSGMFTQPAMWRNAATYHTPRGTCGVMLREFDEGRGEFTLFYESTVGSDTRQFFEGFVNTHLQRYALPQSIAVQYILACPGCGLDITQAAQLLRQRGENTYQCGVCKTVVILPADGERAAPAPIADMNETANQLRDLDAAAYTLQGKIATNDFDVFLCHNSGDKPLIRKLGAHLKKHGILPWLDEEQLRPGLPWQRALEHQIANIKTVAVFVGENGIGPWQHNELDAFLREFVRRGCPVIPVILPKCPNPPDLPIFLQGMTWVDFRVRTPNPMQRLIWGITGDRDRLRMRS